MAQLAALTLAAIGGLMWTSATPNAETLTRRAVIPYYKSLTAGFNQAFSAIDVVNNSSSRACTLQVVWFPRNDSLAPRCTHIVQIGPGRTHEFCSSLPNDITTCDSICSPSLDDYQGKVIISMTSSKCDAIGVDARIYFHDADNKLTAVSSLAIIPLK